MSNFTQATPFLQMKDVDAAVHFFVDVLGFRTWVHTWDFAYLQRDAAAVRLINASTSVEERMVHGARAFLFYVDVKDLSALIDEVRPKLLAAGLPAGQGPVDQIWGQREWWVSGPEGGLVIFGQDVGPDRS